MPSGLSIPQIARKYETSEYEVKKLIAAGDVKHIALGRYGIKLYDPRDVRTVGQRLRLGQFERTHRQVVVHEELEEQALALRATGVEVLMATSVMDAVSQYDGDGLCVLVWPAFMPEQDANLLVTLLEGLSLILVGDERHVDARLERRSTVVEAYRLRRLVQVAWMRIEQRLEQTHLRL